MTDDPDRRRRLLIETYRRYLDAEIGWVRARNAARRWFPQSNRPYRWTMGDPGSRMRHIHETRQRAMLQLMVARLKLRQEKERREKRRAPIRYLPAPLIDHQT